MWHQSLLTLAHSLEIFILLFHNPTMSYSIKKITKLNTYSLLQLPKRHIHWSSTSICQGSLRYTTRAGFYFRTSLLHYCNNFTILRYNSVVSSKRLLISNGKCHDNITSVKLVFNEDSSQQKEFFFSCN